MNDITNALNWTVRKLEDIKSLQLYDILKLRADVFVVEQECIYPDIDGKDVKALHVIGTKDSEVIAYTRIFDSGEYFEMPSIGRVVVKESERKHKYGHELIRQSIEAINNYYGSQSIKISAQVYLTKFYETHDFRAIGTEYLEDGIPHVAMIRKPKTG
ncbi:MAG: GNAT family N-acetyltransferase [Cyclobacteriaceae bacterium]